MLVAVVRFVTMRMVMRAMIMAAVLMRLSIVRGHDSFVSWPGFFCQSPRPMLDVHL
jgi:hypothetical protein